MKSKLFGLLVIVFFSLGLSAQECQFYYPQTVGAELLYKMFDKKGKLTSTMLQEVKTYKITANGAEATIHVKTSDEKGKNLYESDLSVRCESGIFYFDMSGYINQQQMEAYKDMEIKMETQNLEMPSKLTIGDKLKDGHIKMEIFSSGLKLMTMEIFVSNRTVAAKEEVTTEAGTFNCYQLTQTIVAKIPIKITTNSKDWFNAGVGLIKSESYSGENLSSSMVLSSLKK